MTNAELRYDPSHHVEASLWVVRRTLIEDLGGWRAATAIHARTPSQDLLTRAWQAGKDLRCYPRVTAIMLHAGTRSNSYQLRDSDNTRSWWVAWRTDDFAIASFWMRSSNRPAGRMSFLCN